MKTLKVSAGMIGFTLAISCAIVSKAYYSPTIIGYRKIGNGFPLSIGCLPVKRCTNLGEMRCTFVTPDFQVNLYKLNSLGIACDLPVNDSQFE
jgi:hypothetical protein